MTEDAPDSLGGPIPFAKVREPVHITAQEREAAILSRLTEIGREHGLTTLYTEQYNLPHNHAGRFKILVDDSNKEVTLIVNTVVTENRGIQMLDIDAGQLFGILKLAATVPQLPRKREDRVVDDKPPHVQGRGITFASMEALEKAIHAVDPWAHRWTGRDTHEGRGG